MTIQKGEVIKVNYVGTFEDGTVFDSSDSHGHPLLFQVGAGNIIKGFEDSVLGREVGEEYSIKLQPRDAYGEYDQSLLGQISITKFPENTELEAGMMFQIIGNDGNRMIAVITDINDSTVSYDMNHPMAGKVLNFKITILETGCEDELQHCGCGCESDHNSGCGDGCMDDCGHMH